MNTTRHLARPNELVQIVASFAAPHITFKNILNSNSPPSPPRRSSKVIKSVLNLSFTDDIDPRPIIVNAMCNTSNSFRLCPRLIEEGSIQILEGYVPRILDPAIITTCAHVLYNLSTNRAVRSDMIVKGAVRVCLKIVNMPGVSDDCLFLAAKALGNMSLDRSSRKKNVGDGFVKILTSLVNRNGVEKRVHAACAEAMAHLSVFQDLISR